MSREEVSAILVTMGNLKEGGSIWFIFKHLSLSLSLVTKLCPTLTTSWTIACQATLSMGFFRQEYWSGLPFPSPGDLPEPGIEPGSPALKADPLPTELWGKPKISIVEIGGNAILSWISIRNSNKWNQGVCCHIQRDSIIYYLSIIYFCIMFFPFSGSDEFRPSDIIYILILYGNNHNLYSFRWMSL